MGPASDSAGLQKLTATSRLDAAARCVATFMRNARSRMRSLMQKTMSAL